MYQVKDVTLNATWQKDDNVFCFNLYIDYEKKKSNSEHLLFIILPKVRGLYCTDWLLFPLNKGQHIFFPFITCLLFPKIKGFSFFPGLLYSF
jgi:hypothetical protein